MTLVVRRRRPGLTEVCLPRGDGTPQLREPMDIDWIKCTAIIMEVLLDAGRKIDHEAMKHFAAGAMFSQRSRDAANEAISTAVCREFKYVLHVLFHNYAITVQPALHTSRQNCTWASCFFQLGQRTIGLHFLNAEPYFEVFQEPRGEPVSKEELQLTLAAAVQPIRTEPEKRSLQPEGGPNNNHHNTGGVTQLDPVEQALNAMTQSRFSAPQPSATGPRRFRGNTMF